MGKPNPNQSPRQSGNRSRNQNQNQSQSITHFSHRHRLELTAPSSPSPPCSACDMPVGGGRTYSCRPCNFSLHVACAQMPRVVNHPSHPPHRLTLLDVPAYVGGCFNCDACGLTGTGFSYHCSKCEFDVHALCANKPLSVRHRSHPQHPLTLAFESPYGPKGFSCDVCGLIGKNQWLYRCVTCEFDAHVGCVAGVAAQPQLRPVSSANSALVSHHHLQQNNSFTGPKPSKVRPAGPSGGNGRPTGPSGKFRLDLQSRYPETMDQNVDFRPRVQNRFDGQLRQNATCENREEGSAYDETNGEGEEVDYQVDTCDGADDDCNEGDGDAVGDICDDVAYSEIDFGGVGSESSGGIAGGGGGDDANQGYEADDLYPHDVDDTRSTDGNMPMRQRYNNRSGQTKRFVSTNRDGSDRKPSALRNTNRGINNSRAAQPNAPSRRTRNPPNGPTNGPNVPTCYNNGPTYAPGQGAIDEGGDRGYDGGTANEVDGGEMYDYNACGDYDETYGAGDDGYSCYSGSYIDNDFEGYDDFGGEFDDMSGCGDAEYFAAVDDTQSSGGFEDPNQYTQGPLGGPNPYGPTNQYGPGNQYRPRNMNINGRDGGARNMNPRTVRPDGISRRTRYGPNAAVRYNQPNGPNVAAGYNQPNGPNVLGNAMVNMLCQGLAQNMLGNNGDVGGLFGGDSESQF